MTANTEKDASMKSVGWTDEEIKAFCGEPDTYSLVKCSSCGYEEKISDWVLAELGDMNIAMGYSEREASTLCPKCGKGSIKRNNA